MRCGSALRTRFVSTPDCFIPKRYAKIGWTRQNVGWRVREDRRHEELELRIARERRAWCVAKLVSAQHASQLSLTEGVFRPLSVSDKCCMRDRRCLPRGAGRSSTWRSNAGLSRRTTRSPRLMRRSSNSARCCRQVADTTRPMARRNCQGGFEERLHLAGSRPGQQGSADPCVRERNPLRHQSRERAALRGVAAGVFGQLCGADVGFCKIVADEQQGLIEADG